MKYTVVWRADAASELAAAWLAAADRRALSAAAEELERRLARDPLRLGVAQGSPLRRLVCLGPVGLVVDVIPDDRKALVLAMMPVE